MSSRTVYTCDRCGIGFEADEYVDASRDFDLRLRRACSAFMFDACHLCYACHLQLEKWFDAMRGDGGKK